MIHAKYDVLKKISYTLYKRYFIDAMGAMVLGLFASVIIGTIISQISQIPSFSFLEPICELLKANSPVVGAAVGVSIATGLRASPLIIYSCAATGAIGYMTGADVGLDGTFIAAGPVGAYISVIVGVELSRLLAGKTKFDILILPFVTIVCGGLVGVWVGPSVAGFMRMLGDFINETTHMQPIFMGIMVSVIVGIVHTSPISSVALCMMMGINGVAAGAATVGCCANMIGFAVISYKDNGLSGSLAQGLGTSMLQVPNIVKKPIIWLPSIMASIVLGPLATTVLVVQNNPIGAGMGTAALIGPINTFITMQNNNNAEVMIRIIIMLFLLPAFLSWIFYFIMYRLGWIRQGDMTLPQQQ